MRKFLLDTGIAGDFLDARYGVDVRGQAEIRKGNAVGVCMPGLAELFAGAAGSDRPEDRKAELRIGLRKLRCWPFDILAAEEFGAIRARLKRMGRPISPIDMQIAAVAKTLPDCILVTKDSDYDAIDGLKTENWAVAPNNS